MDDPRYRKEESNRVSEAELTLADYQRGANRTLVLKDWQGNDQLFYVTMGLAGEAGEVANKVKKVLRGDYDEDALYKMLVGELGDVLWYLAALCTALELDLSDVAQANLSKLASRAERGVIQGNGDDR
jgi:NTP pyrophosphatase (non-canonical NTP hydrolase)